MHLKLADHSSFLAVGLHLIKQRRFPGVSIVAFETDSSWAAAAAVAAAYDDD